MSDTPTIETKSVTTAGPELADIIAAHLADGWRLVAQSTLGAGEFELHFVRMQEARP